MPIKTILVYLPSVKAAATLMPTVGRIAEPGKAHIVGLHVSQAVPVYAELTAELPPDIYEKLSEASRKNAEAVRSTFEEAAKANQMSCEWRYVDLSFGLGEPQIVAETHCADLIVCAKPSDDAADPWSEFPETALLQSGRPVLIVPASCSKDASFGKNVVIAWNNTRESTRSIFDALDFLRAASSVRIVTQIDDEDEREEAETAGTKLLAVLSRHGIAARFDVSFAGDISAGEILFSRLVDEGCDLLVMGGYSRSPLREMVFGGASRTILRETWVPTLVSH
jgi:nucleotide-binding universal stress UspA family protein